MAYFATVTVQGQPYQVNLDLVEYWRPNVSPGGKGAVLHFSKENELTVDEDSKAIAKLCLEASGARTRRA